MEEPLVDKRATTSSMRGSEATRATMSGKKKRTKQDLGATEGFFTRMFSPASKAPQAVGYRYTVGFFILLNIGCFVLSTYHGMADRCALCWIDPGNPRYDYDFFDLFESVEALTSWVFLFDYITHLLTVTTIGKYAGMGPCSGRLAWAVSFDGLLDGFATFPFFVDNYVLPLLSQADDALPNLTWVRIFRIFVIFRTSKYAHAMNTVARVLSVHQEILAVTMFLVIFMLLFTSAMLWAASDGHYNGLPSAMYDALLMLTGQGGPDFELTTKMELVTAITAFLSVPFFAVPAAMLTWGFEGEAERLAEKTTRRFNRKKTYGEFAEELSDSEEEEGEDTLDEYLQRWGGEDSTEEVEESALAFFEAADSSSTGAELYHSALQRSRELKRAHETSTQRATLRHDALLLLEQVAEEEEEEGDPDPVLQMKLVRFRKIVQSKNLNGSSESEPSISEVMAEIKELKEMVSALSKTNGRLFG